MNVTNVSQSFDTNISANLTQVGLWKNGLTLIPLGDQGYRCRQLNGVP
jgi:hypothetical protein